MKTLHDIRNETACFCVPRLYLIPVGWSGLKSFPFYLKSLNLILNLSSHYTVDVLLKKRLLAFVCTADISHYVVRLRYVFVLVGQLPFSIFSYVIQGIYLHHFILFHIANIPAFSVPISLLQHVWEIMFGSNFGLFAQMTVMEYCLSSRSLEGGKKSNSLSESIQPLK